MKALLVLYALVLLIVGANAATLTPYGVPMFGFPPANTPARDLTTTTTTNCQAITGVGDVKGFGLWVDATSTETVYPTDYSMTVTMGVLTSSDDVVFARTVPAKWASTLPCTQDGESGKTWRNYWAIMDVSGLDPSATYVLCMAPPSCYSGGALNYAQTSSGNGGLTITSGSVTSGSVTNDLIFSIATTNIVVPANPSYSDAFLYTQIDCVYRTTYPLLQIDFQNLLIDTSFADGATTVLQAANYGASCPGTWPNPPTPLGQINSCLYGSGTQSYGTIDLRGTMWAVSQSFNAYGYAASGSYNQQDTYGQYYLGSVYGSCGMLMTSEAYSDNDSGNTNYGGSYIGITPVSFCSK